MHRRSARARCIYTCSSGRRERPHRSALALRRRTCRRACVGCINCARDLACITSICDAEQLYTDAALELDASTRVAAAAGKRPDRPALTMRRRPSRWVTGRNNLAHARAWREGDLASLGWICVAEQLYTDAALVLDASTRVAAAAGSGLIDLHFAFVDDHADGSQAASTRSCSVLRGS
jgi:hypothetical protein